MVMQIKVYNYLKCNFCLIKNRKWVYEVVRIIATTVFMRVVKATDSKPFRSLFKSLVRCLSVNYGRRLLDVGKLFILDKIRAVMIWLLSGQIKTGLAETNCSRTFSKCFILLHQIVSFNRTWARLQRIYKRAVIQ